MPKAFMDITGQKFGRLTAITMLRFRGVTKWICRCECGQVAHVTQGNLGSGNTKSCGCGIFDGIIKHRDSKTSEYNTWVAMNQRCSNPNAQEYENYGGRGISVCDRWNPKKTDSAYQNFLQDMGRRPFKSYSLDRIDNNGNYGPGNCQWADKKAQRLNQRSRIRWFSHEGKTLCISDWAREKGVPREHLVSRLNKGMSLPEALENIHTVTGR